LTTLILPRSSWSPRYQDGDLNLSGTAEAVVAHHTVTHADGDTEEAERAHMRFLEGIGQERFGTGISYNVVIFPSGRAYQGVSFNRRGTHTGGHNSTVRSICFVGNFETDFPSDAALVTGARIYEEGKNRWWLFNAPVNGHRDYKSTACPGRNVYSHLDAIESGTLLDDGPVFVDNPIPPITPPKPATPPSTFVDGFWGRATTARLQRVLGTPVDGIVSSQTARWRDSNPGLTTGWRWTARGRGSQVIFALQDALELPHGQRDGLVGPYTISRLQAHLGTSTHDGVLSRNSRTIMALQRHLEEGSV